MKLFLILTALMMGSVLANAAEQCSTQNDKSIASDIRVQRQTVALVKASQQVVRTDCSGKVTSNKVEVVTPPQDSITIWPAKKLAASQNENDTVYNRTTCEDQGLGSAVDNILAGLFLIPELEESIEGDSIVFEVNASDDFGMLVRTGDNYIDYQFATCTNYEKDNQGQSTGNCLASNVVEKGTLILTVTYQEQSLSGTKTIPADPSTCKK